MKYKIHQTFVLKNPSTKKAESYRATIVEYVEDRYTGYRYKMRWTEPGAKDVYTNWTENGIDHELLMVNDPYTVKLNEDLFTL